MLETGAHAATTHVLVVENRTVQSTGASLWMLAATFFSVLTYVFVKRAPEDLWFGDIFFVRSIFLFVCLYVFARSRGVPLASPLPGLQFVRASIGVTAFILNIVAVQHLPLATAQTLTYTAPLFVGAWTLFLRRRAGAPADAVLLCMLGVGFSGVVLTMHPSLAEGQAAYALVALGAALCATGGAILLKKLGQSREPIARTAFWFGAVALVVSSSFWIAASEKDLLTLLLMPDLIGVGLCTVLAQVAQAKAWGHGRTLLCANLQFSAILFSVCFGMFFFDESFDLCAWTGIALILLTEVASGLIQIKRHARCTRCTRSEQCAEHFSGSCCPHSAHFLSQKTP